jgi:lipopolysaccharide export system protein LptA
MTLAGIKKGLLAITMMVVLAASAQTNVEITGGEKLSVDQRKNYTYIVGNVVIKHDGVVIQCDSAIRKGNEGIIEGFGHIYIYQQDTFTLSGGEYLRYVEADKTAVVTGKNVILQDQNMTLLSTELQYNIKDQIGFYTKGADILSDKNTLKSRRGYYNRRSNTFNFKDNVQLKSPDYTMYSDTLDYFATSRTAYFYGPTRIISKENTIVCNSGWYNTISEKASFNRGAQIHSEKSSIIADSLFYDRKQGLGKGTGNIRLCDSSESFTVYGQKGTYYQRSNESYITEAPMAMQTKDKDTLYVMAETFYFKNDSLDKRMRAYKKASVYQKELQGVCDSLEYAFNDSTISLFNGPLLWNGKNQISGDTMYIQLKNNKINTLKVSENAFLASEVKPGFYNQIAGKEMINRFDSNKLKSVMVEGNAQSIYYLRDNETDSAEYTGVNKVACGRMLIVMDSSKVKAIKFYVQPEGKMYPLLQFPESEKYLSGLEWRVHLIPKKEGFLERAVLVSAPISVKPTKASKPVKKPAKKKPKK